MSADARYFLMIGDERQGPFDLEHLDALLREDKLPKETVWSMPGGKEWKSLAELQERIAAWDKWKDWTPEKALAKADAGERREFFVNPVFWGWLIILISFAGMGYFFSQSASVEVRADRVNNLGLLVDKICGMIGSAALGGFGCVILVLDKLERLRK
jgi:hypothetical protein